MDTEQTIAEIEWLDRILTVPDTRPLNDGDLSAVSQPKLAEAEQDLLSHIQDDTSMKLIRLGATQSCGG
jgi:hypothetical protein